MTSPARRYIFGRMSRIPGYMNPMEALLFAAILDTQNSIGWRGDVCEIGTYYGRSYLLMRHLMAPDEKLLSIDIYEDTGDRDSSPRFRALKAAAQALGFDVNDALMLGADSRTLSSHDLTARAGPFRFVHIDGGHNRDHVQADAQLTLETLSSEGVICFDDFYNPLWPEVTSGVYEFMREHGDFAPLFFANMKVFLVRRENAEAYKSGVVSSLYMRGVQKLACHYDGDEAVLFKQPNSTRLAFRALEMMRLQRLGSFVYR